MNFRFVSGIGILCYALVIGVVFLVYYITAVFYMSNLCTLVKDNNGTCYYYHNDVKCLGKDCNLDLTFQCCHDGNGCFVACGSPSTSSFIGVLWFFEILGGSVLFFMFFAWFGSWYYQDNNCLRERWERLE